MVQTRSLGLDLLVLSQPLVSLGSGHALDGFLGILGLGAADGVQEELAALGLVQALLIAGGIAELAEGTLCDQLGGLGVVFNFANDLLHEISSFFRAARWAAGIDVRAWRAVPVVSGMHEFYHDNINYTS